MNHTRDPRSHTLGTRSCNRLSSLYFWFAGSLEDSFVQEQNFELELHGSRKQKRHQEVNQEVAVILDLKPINNMCCLHPSLVPKQEFAERLSRVWGAWKPTWWDWHPWGITHFLEETHSSFGWEMTRPLTCPLRSQVSWVSAGARYRQPQEGKDRSRAWSRSAQEDPCLDFGKRVVPCTSASWSVPGAVSVLLHYWSSPSSSCVLNAKHSLLFFFSFFIF